MKLYRSADGHANFLTADGRLIGMPLSSDQAVAEGMQPYYVEEAGEPDYDLIAPDHAAYLCRVRAALLDADGRHDLAAQARADAETYDRAAAHSPDTGLQFTGLKSPPVVDPDAIEDVDPVRLPSAEDQPAENADQADESR
jgi:hypothetical protein